MSKNGLQKYLFVYWMEFEQSPLIKRYQTLFDQLDLSFIKQFNTGVGATGYSRHALIKALIYQKLECIASISMLTRHLKDHPIVADVCGFDPNEIPDETVFYRFLKRTKNSTFQKIHYLLNQRLIEIGILSLNILAIDSKPILANTKENNIKNPNRNLTNKNKKPTADPNSALGYFSSSNNSNTGKKKLHFCWGYRNHAIVDTETEICLVEISLPINIKDEIVAKKLLRKLKKLYKIKDGIIILGDKAYDTKDIFNLIVYKLKGIPIIPKNPRNTKERITDEQGRPICEAKISMAFDGIFSDNNRTRAKFRCPIKRLKKIRKEYNNMCPIEHTKFVNGKKYGCTAYITIPDDARALIHALMKKYSEAFQKIRKKRKAIERYFARLQALRSETPLFFNKNSIANSTTIAHISLSAVALAAIALKKLQKIRSYKTFACI